MPPAAGKSNWEATIALATAPGNPMPYNHPSEIMDEIAALAPGFNGVSYAWREPFRNTQWLCNDAASEGKPITHVGSVIRARASS